MATIASLAIADAGHVASNARRGLRRKGMSATGRAAALVAELDRTADLVERVVAQTRIRLDGGVPDGSTRVVSLHDADARPIAKGRLGKPVEFGYKAQVVDNADGVVLDHTVVVGNPADAPMLVPAIARITARFGRAPAAVTADRGYGEACRGLPGSEARISHLKRDYGWARSRVDGIGGTQAWCGWGVLAHNATKVSALIEDAGTEIAPLAPAATTPGETGPWPTTKTCRCRRRLSPRSCLPFRSARPDGPATDRMGGGS